ncbi:DUF4476 domain-containing protein [Niastella populi]|nr:DUF4476 domain-containing protein [Niastella populi]
MKKTCILILFLLPAFLVRALAGPDDGILGITNLSRQNITIEIDGRTYTDVTNALILRNFRPGNHIVKVYTMVRSTPVTRLARRVVLYNKSMYVKPKYYVDIVINRFGRALYDEQPITDNRYDGDGVDERDDRNNNNNWPGRNNDRDNYNGGRPPRNDNYPPRPMDDNTFSSFIETVRRESFDDSRMAIAKSGIDQNYFTSAQAKLLVALFSFENSKLEAAKYMYGRTTDQKNYFVVYSVFSFSKTKEELAEYVRAYKP